MMLTRKWTQWTSWLVLPGVLLFANAITRAAEDGDQSPHRAVRVYQVMHAGEGDYWIGVMGAPTDPLLQKHLKIETGVLIQHVVPDSPADKAGIKQDDILLKFGDKEVTDVMELAKAVADNEDKKAKITLIHEGEEKTVNVTPAERPDTLPVFPNPLEAEFNELEDLSDVKEWMKKLQEGEFGNGPLRMWSMQPGVVVPKEWKHLPAQPFRQQQLRIVLPKNTSLTITRPSDGPAKIIVKKDGQTWEVNEDELDKLPDDVRQIVKGVLGRSIGFAIPGGGDFRIEWDGKRFKQPIQPTPRRKPIPKVEGDQKAEKPPADRDFGTVLKKLDEMNRRLREREKETQREMEKLRQEVEKLKKTEI